MDPLSVSVSYLSCEYFEWMWNIWWRGWLGFGTLTLEMIVISKDKAMWCSLWAPILKRYDLNSTYLQWFTSRDVFLQSHNKSISQIWSIHHPQLEYRWSRSPCCMSTLWKLCSCLISIHENFKRQVLERMWFS